MNIGIKISTFAKKVTVLNISLIVFILLLLLCLGHAAYYYPRLPDRVASHFGASGQPDAWSGKESFMKIYLMVVVILAVLFPGIGLILRRIPASLINLPNKDYLLSPERRQETIDVLSRQFLWFGSATLLLLLDIFHQSFRVHLGKAQALEHPWISIVTYMVFTTFWSVALIVKFMRAPLSSHSDLKKPKS